MKQASFLSLADILAGGRPDDFPVARHEGRRESWGQLRQRIAGRRRAAEARRRVLVADACPLDFLAGLLAALADGHVPVIPPNFQPATLAALADLPPPTNVPAGCLELYTSGSTGEAKCVEKSWRQLEAECRVLEGCWGGVLAGATVVATTPHHHIYGLLFRLLWPLCAGRPFATGTIGEPTSLAETLAFLPDTVLVSSPAQLSRLPDLLDLAAIGNRPRLVFSSGGPLAPATAGRFAAVWGAAPVEIFGSTETGGVAWRRQDGPETPWTPLPDVVLATAADGALLVRSPFLADDQALRMEDGVAFFPDGRFQLQGRLDRIVKIEEKRLSLPEMEAWLSRHPAVAGAALAPVRLGSRTVVGAVVAAGAGREMERKALVAALKAHLAEKYDAVLLPRRWRFVDSLPYNQRGKLLLQDLVALLESPL